MYTLKQLSDGEVWIDYSKDKNIPLLKYILKLAFPKDTSEPAGHVNYYKCSSVFAFDYWVGINNNNYYNKTTASVYEIELPELPEYFCIKRDSSNPLWKKFIDWGNNKYQTCFANPSFANFFGVYKEGGRDSHWTWYSSKSHTDLEISLEQWNACVNPKAGFVLPKKWCVEITKSNSKELSTWINTNKQTDSSYTLGRTEIGDFLHFPKLEEYHLFTGVQTGYILITFEQFKKYVLKMDKKIIGYKLKDVKYADAAIKIDGGLHFGQAIKREQILKIEFESAIENFRKLNLLDEWFEPVYEEPSKDKTFNIRSLSGTFQLTAKKEGLYFAPENKVIDPVVVRDIITPKEGGSAGYWFTQNLVSVNLGCKKEIIISDLDKVLSYWEENFGGK